MDDASERADGVVGGEFADAAGGLADADGFVGGEGVGDEREGDLVGQLQGEGDVEACAV